MSGDGGHDYYALLGVAPGASGTEVRNAYRRLARQHHPDLAGAASTARFRLVAEAYEVLADPARRSAYDADREKAARATKAATTHSDAHSPRTRVANQLDRISDHLDRLEQLAIAARAPDGAVELRLEAREQRSGGTAVIDAVVQVPCPTCGGTAQRSAFWCMRCEFAGTVADEITFVLRIPAGVENGTTFRIPIDRHDTVPPLRLRIRV